jgi:hypothetical protein
MVKTLVSLALALVVIGAYVAVLAVMVLGWKRWAKGTRQRTPSSILSLIGFTLATASGLLAVSSMLLAHAIGGFPYYDPRLLRIYRCGGWLSLSGFVFAIGGVWRPSLPRWYAPFCALGTFRFWFLSAAGE